MGYKVSMQTNTSKTSDWYTVNLSCISSKREYLYFVGMSDFITSVTKIILVMLINIVSTLCLKTFHIFNAVCTLLSALSLFSICAVFTRAVAVRELITSNHILPFPLPQIERWPQNTKQDYRAAAMRSNAAWVVTVHGKWP